MKLTIEPVIREAAPNYAGTMIRCHVHNSPSNESLWKEISAETGSFRQRYVVEDINKLPGIYEMRQLYKKLGKDPNRYRPSAEALCRRLLKDKELYKISTLVDMINLVSIRTGFSIGGFDGNQVQGQLSIGVGRAGEPFHAIGRGLLNIEGLPVYRDEAGCIGTPTSDEERTKLTMETCTLLMVIHSAGGKDRLSDAVDLSLRLLKTYTQPSDVEVTPF
ncbi:MAG: phenylalanine--tRNA ligase beta subunit-related protein [Bacteroidota bacterium]|nr:phenylalanine--tRNA ligase beta subunit-related protein [Bacteroidota bacterium]